MHVAIWPGWAYRGPAHGQIAGTEVTLSNTSHRLITVKSVGLSTWATDGLWTSAQSKGADEPAPTYPLEVEPGTSVTLYFEIPDDRITGAVWLDITGKAHRYRRYRLFEIPAKWRYRAADLKRHARGPIEKRIRRRELARRKWVEEHITVTSSWRVLKDGEDRHEEHRLR